MGILSDAAEKMRQEEWAKAKLAERRLRGLVDHIKKVRNAQKAYFTLPKVTSKQLRDEYLNTAKRAEATLDTYLKQLEYEGLT